MRSLTQIVAVVIFMVGCSRYEEGSYLSFRSKEARVANNWEVKYATLLDEYGEPKEEITERYDSYTYKLTRDREFVLVFTFGGKQDSVEGGWEFTEKKGCLISDFNYKDFSSGNQVTAIDTWHILKLYNKRMWLTNQQKEIHLKPKNND